MVYNINKNIQHNGAVIKRCICLVKKTCRNDLTIIDKQIAKKGMNVNEHGDYLTLHLDTN